MIKGLNASYEHFSPFAQALKLVSPEDVSRDARLSRVADRADRLLYCLLSGIFHEIDGGWGIERNDDDANASLTPLGDEVVVLLTSGMCRKLNEVRELFLKSDWLTRIPEVALFYKPCAKYVSLEECAEFICTCGVAVLLGHELGHRRDFCHLSDVDAVEAVAHQGEEISADGHAILACLPILDAWAFDRAPENVDARNALRKLGAVLLAVAAGMPMKIAAFSSWSSTDGSKYPEGAQRLAGICVQMFENFESEDGFVARLYAAALAGLAECGSYDGPLDIGALILLVFRYDPGLVESQFAALQDLIDGRITEDLRRILSKDV